MSENFDALLDEMDSQPVRYGRPCFTCTKPTPEQLDFIHRAHARGHSFSRISRKLREALGLELTEAAIAQHFRSGHHEKR